MPQSQRVSEPELEERIALIRRLIDRGFTGSEVWRYIESQTDWNISRAHSYNLYNRAYEDMADEAAKVNRAAYFTRSLARFDYIYQKAIGDNDLVNARKATENVVSLLRLDTPGASFDWTQAIADKGINPTELIERLKRLTAADTDESEDDHANRQTNS